MIAFSVVKGVRKRCLRMCALIRAYILCRMWHVNRGRGVAFFGKTILRAYSKDAISLGDNVTVLSKTSYNLVGLTNPSIICACAGARIKIGSYTGLSSTVIHARNSVTIGNYVKIGGNVRIFDHDFHSIDWTDRRPPEDRLQQLLLRFHRRISRCRRCSRHAFPLSLSVWCQHPAAK